jgi:hypothetical protein
MITIDDCRLIDLPCIGDRNGNITPIYGWQHVPFEIERVYYLYDVPGGAARGGHAHKELQQLIVSVMGDAKDDLEGTGELFIRRNLPCISLYPL